VRLSPINENELASYDVSPLRGFLPADDPLERLPSAFDEWERLASTMPALLASRGLRHAVDRLATLNMQRLETDAQIHRAMLLLSLIGNASVLGATPPATTIRAALAVPWCALAQKLGRHPIGSHASFVLYNWRRLDRRKPIALDNLAPLVLFTGTQDEAWFYLTTAAIEVTGAPALTALVRAQAGANAACEAAVGENLSMILNVVGQLEAVLLRMRERCAPQVFYDRIRPLLSGWPDPGVVYEGVDRHPRKFAGGSAAQSSLLQAIDAGLGISYAGSDASKFLVEMRKYMPPNHKRFIEALEAGPSVRDFVLSRRASHPALRDRYNACVRALESFRTQHLAIAVEYVLDRASSIEEARGTGGTSFVSFLTKVRNATRQCMSD
jgi:indoleamine 2,3-dioxygenase